MRAATGATAPDEAVDAVNAVRARVGMPEIQRVFRRMNSAPVCATSVGWSWPMRVIASMMCAVGTSSRKPTRWLPA